MKTRDLRSEAEALIGFSVSSFVLSRHAVPRIIAGIPGATVVRKQRRFAISAPDDFCEFVVDGKTFLAIEPFGDNTEFWLVTEPPEECPQLETVRQAFERHRAFLPGKHG